MFGRLYVRLAAVAATMLPHLQSVRQLGEVRTTYGQLRPAFHHERVAVAGACFRTRQQLSRTDHVDHLLVVEAVVGLQEKKVFSYKQEIYR